MTLVHGEQNVHIIRQLRRSIIVAYKKKINLCVVSKENYCLGVTCWERVDLLDLVCDVYCDFVTFPFGILGKVWYLIVSIPFH